MGEAAAEKDFYWKLFKSTFIISAFTIGGGFVIIPLLKAKFVDEYKWMDDKEALNLVAIAQSAPGVVAANAAISMGYKLGGIRGTLTALLATILPPLITLSIISYAYDAFAHNQYIQLVLKGMQCGATAIIINVAIDLLKKELKKKRENALKNLKRKRKQTRICLNLPNLSLLEIAPQLNMQIRIDEAGNFLWSS